MAHEAGVTGASAGLSGSRSLAVEAGRHEIRNGEHLGLDAVVGVVGEVGDFVGEVDDLRFEARIETGIEFPGGRPILKMGMFDDALAHLKAQIKAAKMRIMALDPIDRAQTLGIMVVAAVRLHQIVESALTGMAKGSVAEVMAQGNGLGEVG